MQEMRRKQGLVLFDWCDSTLASDIIIATGTNALRTSVMPMSCCTFASQGTAGSLAPC